MPGDDWQRFANLRALYGFMWAHPGKKLLFMGGEFAQPTNGAEASLPWHLLDATAHSGTQRLVRDLNIVYRQPALHQLDFSPKVLPGSRTTTRPTPSSRSRATAGRQLRRGGVQLHAGRAACVPHRRAG